MKTTIKYVFTLLLLAGVQDVEAQLFKRLKDKLTNKVERKIDGEIDKSIDNIGKTPSKSKTDVLPGEGYTFTTESKVQISNLEDGSVYKLSYLLNTTKPYVGLKTNLADYSDGDMTGESVIIMDGDAVHIFVDTQGMKMRISQEMMGDQQHQNPMQQMADYDYSGIQKTGQTKNILGALCYEYLMSDKEVVIKFWVAPSIALPNWFIQNKKLIDGHIMAYEMRSKDGHVKGETLSIDNNIKEVLNPKEYKKMF